MDVNTMFINGNINDIQYGATEESLLCQ